MNLSHKPQNLYVKSKKTISLFLITSPESLDKSKDPGPQDQALNQRDTGAPVSKTILRHSGGRVLFFKPYLEKSSTGLCRSRRWEGSRYKTPIRIVLSDEMPCSI